jgi:hypothetical protein
MEQVRRIMRPTDIPDSGILCDLLWSDPDKDITGWGENDRGVSYTFGSDVVTKFLAKHDLDLVCRAHQVLYPLALSSFICFCSFFFSDSYVTFPTRLLRMGMSFLLSVNWLPFFPPLTTAASSTTLVR